MRLLWSVVFGVLLALVAGCSSATDNDVEVLGQVASPLATISIDASAYPAAGVVKISFGGVTPNRENWAGLRPVGGAYDRWKYLPYPTESGVIDVQLTAAGRGWYEAFISGPGVSFAVTAPFYVGPRVLTDRASYTPTDSIHVTYGQANPGANGLDWLAITPVGGTAQSYVRWGYTGGALNGSQSFPVGDIAPGVYEARLYGYNDVLQGKSDAFTISARRLTRDQATYLSAESATFTFNGATASGTDWIAIIPNGAPNTSFVRWQYTNQQGSGSLSIALANLASGVYVAKLFANNNTSDLQATSASFSINANETYSVAADKARYLATETINLSFRSAPPTAFDWIAVAPVGAPSSAYVYWAYTNAALGELRVPVTGIGSGSGSYEARLYANNTFELKATSSIFTVEPFHLSADKTNYARFEKAKISFNVSPATPQDWIAIAPVGGAPSSYVAWTYTGGTGVGLREFSLLDLPGGSYEARFYANNTLKLRATSASFAVSGMSVTTTMSSYARPDPAIAVFAGLPGNAQDWIAIALPGSPAGSYVQWAFSNGRPNGQQAFHNLAVGTYVVRLHINNGNDIEAESAPFAIQ